MKKGEEFTPNGVRPLWKRRLNAAISAAFFVVCVVVGSGVCLGVLWLLLTYGEIWMVGVALIGGLASIPIYTVYRSEMRDSMRGDEIRWIE